jgi:CheY-like chemotaxis protein
VLYDLPNELEEKFGDHYRIDPIRKVIQISTLVKLLKKAPRKSSNKNIIKPPKKPGNESDNDSTHSLISTSSEDELKNEKEMRVPLDVLVVEDIKTNQKVMQLMLDRIEGITYEFADNGLEGYEKFLARANIHQKYDCIFMDLQMPVMDGAAATIEIRKAEIEKGYPRTHIVALTANAFSEERDRCLELVCTFFQLSHLLLFSENLL